MANNATIAKRIAEKHIPQATRDAIPDEDFGDPTAQKFPIRGQQDLDDAAHLIGHASPSVKARIITIAKRKQLTLPKAWQDATEALSVPVSKQRLARVKCYFLEDGAVSLNGRKYPREAVDTLIRSAQLQLSDPDSLPITSYLSHEDADRGVILSLAGKVTDVQREGTKAYAMVDIPNTAAGRDVLTLMQGKYLRTTSLRASGAEMRYDDSESTMPLVGGKSLKFEGLDWTTTPGLPQVAKIADITESHEPQSLIEIFNAPPSTMLLEQGETMDTIQEEVIAPMASGVTQGVSDTGDPRGAYAKRQYPVPDVQMNGDAAIDQQIHDHIAGAMNLECSPLTSAESLALRKSLEEAGAKFNQVAKQHLLAAHDAVAQKLGVECKSGGNGKMANDMDGDEKSGESAVNDLINALRETLPQPTAQPAVAAKEKPMTPQEAAQLLADAGYSIKAPPTEEEKLQEKLTAMQADFDRKLQEQLASSQQQQLEAFKQALAESKAPQPAPQRKSLVEGAYAQTAKRPYYRNGDYLREQIQAIDFERMLDRSAPLPENVDLERLLRELYPATWTLTPDEWNRDKNI